MTRHYCSRVHSLHRTTASHTNHNNPCRPAVLQSWRVESFPNLLETIICPMKNIILVRHASYILLPSPLSQTFLTQETAVRQWTV